jgi:hypothetical protein
VWQRENVTILKNVVQLVWLWCMQCLISNLLENFVSLTLIDDTVIHIISVIVEHLETLKLLGIGMMVFDHSHDKY